jgi:hypothetical protein
MSGAAVGHSAAWPYEVLLTVPYADLVAADDGEAWQQELAVKLLEAEPRQAIACQHTSRGSARAVVRSLWCVGVVEWRCETLDCATRH